MQKSLFQLCGSLSQNEVFNLANTGGNFPSTSYAYNPPFLLGTRSPKSFKADDLTIYRAITSEQIPPSLPFSTHPFCAEIETD